MKKTLQAILSTGLVLSTPNCRENEPPTTNPSSSPKESVTTTLPTQNLPLTTRQEETPEPTTRPAKKTIIPFYHNDSSLKIELPARYGKSILFVNDYEPGVDLFAGYIVGDFMSHTPDSQTPITYVKPVSSSEREEIRELFKNPEKELRIWELPGE